MVRLMNVSEYVVERGTTAAPTYNATVVHMRTYSLRLFSITRGLATMHVT